MKKIKIYFLFIICLGLYFGCSFQSNLNDNVVSDNKESSNVYNVQKTGNGHKFVGNIILDYKPSYYSVYWSHVTNGYGDWGETEQNINVYDWSKIDAAYNFAKSAGLLFKAQTLVCARHEPDWLRGLCLSCQRAEIAEWICLLGSRYPNCDYIDVINEPLHGLPSYRNAIGGDGSTGYDWVIWSFEKARQYFPGSNLLINEYGIISDPSAAAQYIQIINILNQRGLIDGIGIQCHYFSLSSTSVSGINRVLDQLASTGLPVYITELAFGGDDSSQLSCYQEYFPVLYEHSAVAGITIWGWIEGDNWSGASYGSYLITKDEIERPALTWLRENYLRF